MTTQSVGEAARFVTIDRGLPSIEWRASALTISDVVSGLAIALFGALSLVPRTKTWAQWAVAFVGIWLFFAPLIFWSPSAARSEEHTSELQSLMRISYAVFCLKKKNKIKEEIIQNIYQKSRQEQTTKIQVKEIEQ